MAKASDPQVILAVDAGGTHTRIGVFRAGPGAPAPVASRTYASGEFDSLGDVLERFTAEHPHGAAAACLAVPGPVRGRRSTTTHLGWTIDADAIAADLNLRDVYLINDLEAVGHALPALSGDQLVCLNRGAPGAGGNRAVIAAGTGLGQAGCFWDGNTHHPFATEGGHGDFAPRNQIECGLLEDLAAEFPRVSAERILSGPGLVRIYRYLARREGGAEDPAMRAALFQEEDPAAIVRGALEGKSARCARALDLFVSLYGAEAGNLALKLMATGGVYIGGGIAPAILSRLSKPAFMEAFASKGRMRPLMESMPVHVIMTGGAGLAGAARYAMMQRSR